jgi:hypothetical protein
MLSKDIIYFGIPNVLICDGKCNKAWGINNRETNQLSDDEDDYETLADDDLGEAPEDPGTYEGDHAKPIYDDEKLNKWCCRECERSVMIEKTTDKNDYASLLRDFSVRRKNKND